MIATGIGGFRLHLFFVFKHASSLFGRGQFNHDYVRLKAYMNILSSVSESTLMLAYNVSHVSVLHSWMYYKSGILSLSRLRLIFNKSYLLGQKRFLSSGFTSVL